MDAPRARQLLGGFTGAVFVVFGLVESTIAVAAQDPILFFWFPALCGGGFLVLLGVFAARRSSLAIGLVTLGALAGALATAWTVVLPLLAVALIVLNVFVVRAKTRTAPGVPVAP